MPLTISLLNGDSSARIFLHLLDNLSTRANNCTDKLFGNVNTYDTRYLWFHFLTRLRDGLHHLIHDMFTTCLGLHKSLFDNIKRQSVTLNIHLCSSQTVLSTGGFKVHVAKMVLISKDVTEDSILVFSRILDQSHGYSWHRFVDRYTRIHHSEGSSTHTCHRRRTVRLENIAHNANGIRKVCGNLSL